MRGRSLLLAAVAWLAVVAATSGVTWAVINAAGQQVLTTSGVPPRVPRAVEIGEPTVATLPVPPTPTSTSLPLPTRSEDPSDTATSPAQPLPTLATAPASTVPEAVVRPGTWQAGPGVVSVRCAGVQASLQSASPSDGYRVEVGGRGPEEVEVTFLGHGLQLQVQAHCVSGAPRFATETEGAGDD